MNWGQWWWVLRRLKNFVYIEEFIQPRCRSLQPASCFHVAAVLVSCPSLQVSKKSSYLQWYWGDTNPVDKLSTRLTFLTLWCGEGPRLRLNRALGAHLDCKVILQCKNWASKGMVVLHSWSHIHTRKSLQPRGAIKQYRHSVVQMHSTVHMAGPSCNCMQQHCPCCLSDVSDGSLSYAILEVSIEATEGKCLLLLFTRCPECIICKSTIVCRISFDMYTVIACKLLDRSIGLGINRFLRCEMFH